MTEEKRENPIFINGGAGRVICSIQHLKNSLKKIQTTILLLYAKVELTFTKAINYYTQKHTTIGIKIYSKKN